MLQKARVGRLKSLPNSHQAGEVLVPYNLI